MLENLPLLYVMEVAQGVPFWRRKSVHMMGVILLLLVGLVIGVLLGYIPRAR